MGSNLHQWTRRATFSSGPDDRTRNESVYTVVVYPTRFIYLGTGVLKDETKNPELKALYLWSIQKYIFICSSREAALSKLYVIF